MQGRQQLWTINKGEIWQCRNCEACRSRKVAVWCRGAERIPGWHYRAKTPEQLECRGGCRWGRHFKHLWIRGGVTKSVWVRSCCFGTGMCRIVEDSSHKADVCRDLDIDWAGRSNIEGKEINNLWEEVEEPIPGMQRFKALEWAGHTAEGMGVFSTSSKPLRPANWVPYPPTVARVLGLLDSPLGAILVELADWFAPSYYSPPSISGTSISVKIP